MLPYQCQCYLSVEIIADVWDLSGQLHNLRKQKCGTIIRVKNHIFNTYTYTGLGTKEVKHTQTGFFFPIFLVAFMCLVSREQL